MKVGYEKLSKDVKKLSKQIKENMAGHHIYDNVYAVPRGGLYAGALIAKYLKLDMVDDVEEIGPLTLVVDDLMDSGKTRRKFWGQDYAVLYTKGKSDIVPTYSVEEINEWIEFPWEKTDSEIEDTKVRLLQFYEVDPTDENVDILSEFLEKL